MMELKISIQSLSTKETFRVSREVHGDHPIVIVSLRSNDIIGFGEATEFKVYDSTVPRLLESFKKAEEFLRNYEFETPEQLWKDIHPVFKDDSFGLAAIDMAAWDLYGKQKGKTVHELLDISVNEPVHSSISISMGDLDFQ
ncbi:MAG: hypothetical protein HRT72_08385, partial [Flavobacteriales bacterium]|nr:hypothetical protein [Flavobacteriales bacterium]